MVFQTLNRLKWKGDLEKAEIDILSRGSPEDRKTIPGNRVTNIKRSHFYFKDNDRETFIPNHRVLEIRKEGRTIWKRKE
ncbi:MAG: DUF504 domain-containing protein [Candidatus Aenigmarchaeota archaeon]|nr:DUF504 domain-containing protein [Candidatus Aenigmarchaeota archaeon]NIP40815.1 DUF504 domain-containing protein [Candidatus Aenigmarchaeota archaeon]NIQ17929.1 DUF504 domain-containing protein [Candidatus Aenigmarchaeota archaeon]NIS73518.1 DUF504 domain-containing protein [Candidatus Aenigmarchaeota archaeon]